MCLATNLKGRLRNTPLPVTSGLLPLFEAVANAIHAIEDADIPAEKGYIRVRIVRDNQLGLDLDEDRKRPGPEAKGDITGLIITDNGIGFTDENMQSFSTLDSEYKADRGGRGVGRLTWLKAFDNVRIQSVYKSEQGKQMKRTFNFNAMQGISKVTEEDAANENRQTEIHLEGFLKRYREASPKTAATIARDLFEHNLWYFIREGGAPQIHISDEDGEISLDNVYEEQMVEVATRDSFVLKGISFDLIHIKLSASSNRKHSIAYCASNRIVTQDSIKGEIAGLYGNLSDGKRDFVYECYVSSLFFDERVRAERTSFDIAENPLELFESTDLSLKEIRDAVLKRATDFLADYLNEKRRLGKERVVEYAAHKAPRYRPIISRIPEDELAVDPEISDKDLELLLHRHFFNIESRLLEDGHDMMFPKENENYEDYKERLREYLKMAEDIKKSDLANYVAHRKVILDLLESAIKIQKNNKYVHEEVIHKLIMPMRKTSDDISFDFCNLWLVDERLAFHDYLASDKPIASMPITDQKSKKRPDLLAFNVFDMPVLVSDSESLPLASIVIVELKRPMLKDAAAGEDKNPIRQTLEYLEQIRKGNVKTKAGRTIPKAENIPGFCYIICDMAADGNIEQQCRMYNLTRTSDFLGYFGYNQNYNAYIEVISFDRLVNSAKERNKAFFDKLGFPSK